MAYTTINKSTAHFETKLYAGSSSNVTVSGLEFQPDWIWLKKRSATDNHAVVDAVRGSGSYGFKNLYPNLTDVEYTPASGNASVVSIASNSFVVGQNSNTNSNGENFVSWNWKAGTGAGSSNTDGSINTASTSVNTTAGFSISKYTGTGIAGATIGHGLGVKPSMIIVKGITWAEEWEIYHKSLGATKTIKLNNSVASSTTSSRWNDTEPTSSVFTVGNADATNKSGYDYIAYCFAEKTGYSKFGSYTGNGNTDGTFVYTGFKPAFVLIKRINSAAHWVLRDNKRDSYNYTYKTLKPDANNAEADDSNYNRVDFLSNGFKLRGGSSGTGTDTNGSEPYIYMSFAEAPLVGSNNVPCTAR